MTMATPLLSHTTPDPSNIVIEILKDIVGALLGKTLGIRSDALDVDFGLGLDGATTRLVAGRLAVLGVSVVAALAAALVAVGNQGSEGGNGSGHHDHVLLDKGAEEEEGKLAY